MKITLMATVLVCFACLACDRIDSTEPSTNDAIGPKDHWSSLSSLDSVCVQSAGVLHNNGLSGVRAMYDFDSAFTSDVAHVAYLVELTYNYFHEAGGWSLFDGRSMQESALLSLVSNGYPNSRGEWERMKTTPALVGNVALAEIVFVDSTLSILSTATSGLTHMQAANRTIHVADSLIAVWNATDWPVNGGELSGGMLQVMKSSAQYWRGHPISTTENPNPPTLATMSRADLVGYLIGWGQAVAEELDASGRLDPDNEWKRIRAGVRMATTFSSAGLASALLNR